MKPTRKDVAKLANVSEQTVSYILNNRRHFSKDITDRVMAAVEELKYQPDMIAKSLSTQRSKLMCIAIDDIANPLFGEIIKSFEINATSCGYFTNIVDINSDFLNFASSLISRRVEGVYVSLIPSRNSEEFIETLIRADIKVVLGNDYYKDNAFIASNAAVVNIDLCEGMKTILRYLKSLDHEDIVYLSGLDIHSSIDSRYLSFCEEYEKLFGKKARTIANEYPFSTTVEAGYRLMQQVFDKKYPCTAVIATNDLMAYGAIGCIRAHGLTVGKDISVVGMDDILFSQYSDPALTSLGFDKATYGKAIFEELNEYIETDLAPRKKSISCDLRIRNSTAKRER